MIKSPVGEIVIMRNGEMVDYISVPLKKSGKNYTVDERYKIELEIQEAGGNIVECILAMDEAEFQGYSESGEELEMISFQQGDIKLSIGTKGDISGYSYEYEPDRLRLKINEKTSINRIVFYVAWITKYSDSNDIYTWFAADPTIDI